MTIRFLVNFGLLALPIAITLGVLIGLQSQRTATGGPPLFKPDPKPTGPKKKHGITTEQHCQKSYGIHPETKGQEYTREFTLFSGRSNSRAAEFRLVRLQLSPELTVCS